MQSRERQTRDTIGSALHRVGLLERALEAGEIQTNQAKLSLELRRVSGDLERALVQVDDGDASQREAHARGNAAERRANLVFALCPTPCFILTRMGTVLDANPAAAHTLNTSLRHFVGRDFTLFVSSDRLRFVSQLQALDIAETPVTWLVTIRPRERGTKPFHCSAVAESEERLLVMLGAPSDADVANHALHELESEQPESQALGSI